MQGELAEGQWLSPCSWNCESEGKQSIPMHTPHVRHSGALMASVPWCGVAWLPTGRNIMKAESGRKLQPRCQMRTQGLQQAGSSNTAQSRFLVAGGVDSPQSGLHHPAWLPFSCQHSPGSGTAWAGKLKARFKVRTREQGGSLSGKRHFSKRELVGGSDREESGPSRNLLNKYLFQTINLETDTKKLKSLNRDGWGWGTEGGGV